MFGKRPDGVAVKDSDIFFKIMPYIMKERNDAQIFIRNDIELKTLDEYISRKNQEGIRITYMDIIYTALIRIYAERPNLNRFIMNGRLYKRKGIYISLVVKKAMTDEAEETVVKLEFTGKENIFEVREKLQSTILENKGTRNENETDKIAKRLSLIPNSLLKFSVGLLKWMDRHGVMPKSVIKASPFHTSAFITNVGSIGLDYVYHHLYNFGTTGLFISIGKKKTRYVYSEDDITKEKCVSLGIVADERICDGFYFASSLKTFGKYLRKPELLEERYVEKEDIK